MALLSMSSPAVFTEGCNINSLKGQRKDDNIPLYNASLLLTPWGPRVCLCADTGS